VPAVPPDPDGWWGWPEGAVRARAQAAAAACDLDLVAVRCEQAPCLTVWRGVGQGTLRRCPAWEAEVDPAFAYLRLWVVADDGPPERLLVFADYPEGQLADGGGPYQGGLADRLTDAAADAIEEGGLRLRTPDEVLEAELTRVLDLTDGDLEHPAVDAVLKRWATVPTTP